MARVARGADRGGVRVDVSRKRRGRGGGKAEPAGSREFGARLGAWLREADRAAEQPGEHSAGQAAEAEQAAHGSPDHKTEQAAHGSPDHKTDQAALSETEQNAHGSPDHKTDQAALSETEQNAYGCAHACAHGADQHSADGGG
jgi:hypothetical protein